MAQNHQSKSLIYIGKLGCICTMINGKREGFEGGPKILPYVWTGGVYELTIFMLIVTPLIRGFLSLEKALWLSEVK